MSAGEHPIHGESAVVRCSKAAWTVARLEWICILVATALVVLVYPLRLDDAWLVGLRQTLWHRFPEGLAPWSARQLEPYLNFFFSPLILKGVLAVLPMILCCCLYLARCAMGAIPDSRHPAGRRLPLALSLVALLAWFALSGLWSPTPDIARVALSWLATFGIFFLVILIRGISRYERIQFGALLMLLGVPVLIVLYMQALPIFGGVIFKVFHDFGSDEGGRNLFGSFIGHNTACAAFLMLTAFPALAFSLSARTPTRRAMALLYLAGVLFGALLLQSRSVWILGAILGVLSVRSALRRGPGRRRRWTGTLLLAVVALGLLTQAIDQPWNPLQLETLSLGRRFQALTPQGLSQESRLRLNLLSARLVPEHPIIGHGLYAYQYVYPRLQGQYFNRHPDSRLHQTIHRSHMAHNEYLQVLINHGVIGLALLLTVLGIVARNGWRLRRSVADPDRLIHQAMGWSSLGFAAHALVDFPFHVPQLLLPAMICSAGWCSPRRALQPVAQTLPRESPATPASNFRPRVFARLLAALLVLGAGPFAMLPMVFQAQADVLRSQGNALVNAYERYGDSLDPDAQAAILERGLNYLNHAYQIEPANYQVLYSLGEAHYIYALMFDSRRRDDQTYSSQQQRQYGQLELKHLKAALEINQRTRRGLDYHLIYYQRALINLLMHRIAPSPEVASQVIENLQKTLAYCPNFSTALAQWIDFVQSRTGTDPRQIDVLKRRLLAMDPPLFGSRYVRPANLFLEQRRYARAALAWEELLALDPDNTEWIMSTILANLGIGNGARARELVDLFYREFPDEYYGRGASVVAATLDDDWEPVIRALAHLAPAARPDLIAGHIVMERKARVDAGYEPRNLITQRPPDWPADDWEDYVDEVRPDVLLRYYQDPQAARRAFDTVLEQREPTRMDFWITGIYIGLFLEDLDFAEHCLDRASEIQPDHPALPDLSFSLQRLRDVTRP